MIKAEHEAFCESARQTLQHAIRAGELLLAAKRAVDHGGWADWLRQNCCVSQRSAQAYMRLAQNKKQFEDSPRKAAGWTIDGALRSLGSPQSQTTAIVAEKSATMTEEIQAAADKANADLGRDFLRRELDPPRALPRTVEPINKAASELERALHQWWGTIDAKEEVAALLISQIIDRTKPENRRSMISVLRKAIERQEKLIDGWEKPRARGKPEHDGIPDFLNGGAR